MVVNLGCRCGQNAFYTKLKNCASA